MIYVIYFNSKPLKSPHFGNKYRMYTNLGTAKAVLTQFRKRADLDTYDKYEIVTYTRLGVNE